MWAICYSPDAKMIATGGDELKIWDANSGELLKIFKRAFSCLSWTSGGKTLIAGGSKFDTAMWTVPKECPCDFTISQPHPHHTPTR
jgi:WD40 repeat protein